MKTNIFMLAVVVLCVLFWAIYQFSQTESEDIYIAFIGPISSSKDATSKDATEDATEGPTAGKIMTQAIELYLEEINSKGGILNGKKIKLNTFDDKNDCQGQAKDEARKIIEENEVLAVIGHWYSGCSISGGQIYKKYGMPAIAPGSVAVKVTQGNEWYFRNIYNASASGQFLAHYVKNVLKLNQVTIIDDRSDYGSYLAEMFESTVHELKNMEVTNRWNFNKNKEKNWKKMFERRFEQLKQNQKPAGAILLAVQASEAVKLVKLIKDAGIQNPIVGGSSFSEQTFVSGFDKFPEEKANPGHYTNDIYVATPLIFDTANQQAQTFKDNYQHFTGNEPDWSAAYAYDSAMVLVEAMKKAKITGTQASRQTDRQKIREELSKLTNVHDAIEGTTGFNYFDQNRDAQKPVAIGVYKNKNIVSALTQFQVMRNPNEVADWETALKNERVLEIDDKKMYKTNVVYTGIKINKISEFKEDNLTFELDFHLWFRFSGDFNPQELEFLNAIDPDSIKKQLEKPLEEKVKAQTTYRAYRIKSSFRADFIYSHYAYKQHQLGVSFHHKSLTRNNLIYVTDVLGMGDTQEMSDELRKNKVLNPALGWSVEKIEFFQAIAERYSLGDPDYLNIQNGKVEYSQFNVNVHVKRNELTPRGKISPGYAANLMILSSIFILLFNIVYKKFRKWSKLVWFFQVILAVILLLSAEVLLVQQIAEQIGAYNMKFVIRIFDILWWIIPAFLINMASESFIWTPIEEKTGRLIPNIVRLFLAFIIYFMAIVGIIAFVYDQQLTSILATSGVIAMIIGLAIQINISNIFSGIAINIERPFRIGDWVKIGDFDEGEIVDITWRTTRLKTRAECILSIPNSMASESPILNFCYPDDVYWLWPTVYVHPMHPPARVRKILLDALLSAEKVLRDPAPVVLFTGINEWAASYWIAFCADDYGDKNFILEDVWTRVWFHLNRGGITPAVQRQEVHLFKGVKERGGEEATKPLTLLQEVDIFKPFSDDAKLHLSKQIRRHRFNPGDTIVQQGDAGDSLFIIVEGVVSVLVQTDDGRTKEVARLGAGNFFGEMALLTGEERTATVKSLVDTYLFELTKADIKPLIAQQREVSELISQILTRRYQATQSAKMHVEENGEIEKEAVYKRFLNRIEQFFGLGDEQ
jgi:potassium-dependent mechanosensitive channel